MTEDVPGGTDPMTTIYDPPLPADLGQPAPPAPWFGAGGPGEPGGPPGYGGGGEGPGNPTRRFRRGLLVAGAVAVLGLGTFAGLRAVDATSGHPVLTAAQIARQVDPGLVDVVSTLGYQQARAAGTGLVLTPSGKVLTNNHVINGATSIKVRDVGNGRSYRARVVGYDQHRDIAVLQLQGASGLHTVTLGNSDSAAVGQKVVALGNAEGKDGTPSVAVGHIRSLGAAITASDAGSGTSERLSGLIHDNASIQPGDSGGPLLNTAGQVIGINTAASTATGFHFMGGHTQAFAIPINEAAAIGSQIEAGHPSAAVHIGATGLMGVEIMSAYNAAAAHPGAHGAIVGGTVPGSPASRAGLTQGDVIVSVDGHRISSPAALQSAMEQHHPGDRVTVGWTGAAGQAHSAVLVLINGPAE
jgi:S1-C subfamily serine protease